MQVKYICPLRTNRKRSAFSIRLATFEISRFSFCWFVLWRMSQYIISFCWPKTKTRRLNLCDGSCVTVHVDDRRYCQRHNVGGIAKGLKLGCDETGTFWLWPRLNARSSLHMPKIWVCLCPARRICIFVHTHFILLPFDGTRLEASTSDHWSTAFRCCTAPS